MAYRSRTAKSCAALAVALFCAGTPNLVPVAMAEDGDIKPAFEAGAAPADRIGDISPLAVVGTAFTYQGHLLVSGHPANGPYDFTFRLLDAETDGIQIGSSVSVGSVMVVDGRFTLSLDFGLNAFGGGARWLEISVRPAGTGGYTGLGPRQKLDPAPYALALPNVYTSESTKFVGIGRDYRISSAETFGVNAITPANGIGGMYVNAEGIGGKPVYGLASNGSVRSSMWYDTAYETWVLTNGSDRMRVFRNGGLEILDGSTTDGLIVNGTDDDGIQIGASNYPNYGLFIPSPGVPQFGLWSNTANPSGNYGLYTPDNIEVGVVTSSAQTVVARVAGGDVLEAGDVVAATGVADPVPGGTNRLALVQLAGRDASGVIGVVAGRMEWCAAKGKEADGEIVLMPVDGPARGGDYVSLVVLGVTDVRVERGASIAKGARVTAAESGGRVCTLKAESPANLPVVGVALESSSGAGTVPVFVNLR